MKKILSSIFPENRSLVMIIFLLGVVVVVIGNAHTAEAIVTSSSNFCNQFTTHPECTGWRTIPIVDNYWFCEYVDLPSMCKYKPDPQKQILPKAADHCCVLYDSHVPNDLSVLYYDHVFEETTKKGKELSPSYPVDELVIWTDKDHYRFGDRINVYGKFDFGDTVLQNGNKSVNVKFNGNTVIFDLPVHENGWFAGYFYISDSRHYWTGSSQISVTYFHTPNQHESGKYATESYQFTTGDIKEPKNSFAIWASKNKFTNDISYGITSSGNEVIDTTSLVVRLTNPDGVVFSLPIHSMDDLNDFVNNVSDFSRGIYKITMTMGDFVTATQFEY